MKIGAPQEIFEGESRVAMTPESALQLQKLGHDCFIQAGAGKKAGFEDTAYSDAGVTVVATAQALFDDVDIIAKVRPPAEAELDALKPGQTLISFFYPAQSEALLEKAKTTGASVIAMDMVPRISRAQKMDALSSMANIAGYRAVMEAGNNFGRFFTGQVTAAGKVPPAKVLVIGAGVAGLAAIGASTSLGAITYAFDVRPEVAEQIESMGAEFVYLDFEEAQSDGATTGGYAAPSSPEFREAQLKKFRELAPDVDIVISTALIPGRDAPVLWTKDMVEAMKRGSVVVDLAAERGGNCELTVKDERIVSDNGVTIVGYTDLPSRMATQSSTLYANNIRHMVHDLTPDKDGVINHNMEDDVIRGATVAHQGEITFPPPPPKVKAIAAQKPKEKVPELTPEERKAQEVAAFKKQTTTQVGLLVAGTALLLLVGAVAPASFMAHFVVFVLACFVGFQVIWKVSHSLHTPLMAVTNAVSGIIVLGALLQIGAGGQVTGGWLVVILAAVSILIATINIVGGFLVTRRMLAMFQKS
ncbi:Re/Si-specific NAD(P)(+) transhydrogenase subunit alpha [Rhodobacteraceae bacterium]|nr:Re/Si-specific NAD(P)(+) transhydrogenase subunit alpha [Paracoccaceae bacterium]